MFESRGQIILRYALSLFVVAIFMFPMFWFLITSLKTKSAIFDMSLFFTPTLDNYRVVMGGSNQIVQGDVSIGVGSNFYSLPSIRDSMIIAVMSTAATTFLALLAAYGISRFDFRGKQGFVGWVLSQRMMPPVAVVVPLFFMFGTFGLYDSYLGVAIAHTLMNLPIAILLLKSFLDDVPKDVDEAAMMDGATRIQTFWRVIVPVVKGGMAATAVLCFVFSWTEYLLSSLLTQAVVKTVPKQIASFVTTPSAEWGYIAALGTASLIPAFVFILLVQRHLVRGLTLGSLKG